MKDPKATLRYREKYKKGLFLVNDEIIKILKKDKAKITIELREKTIYNDGSEEIVVAIRL